MKMDKKKLEGNLAMIGSKFFGGLNMNALKFIIPVFISPIALVSIRVVFAAIAFWIISFLYKDPEKKPLSINQVFQIFMLGVFCIYGYLVCFMTGLKYTTPISSAIILSLSPLFVFLISAIFFSDKVTLFKVFGIALGIGGVVLNSFSHRTSDLASDPILGDLLTLASTCIFSIYLIFSKRLLRNVSPLDLIKWCFTGAAVASIIFSAVIKPSVPLIHESSGVAPWLVIIFILIFPTVISYLLLPIALRYISATVVAMYGYEVIVVATVTSYILGQDRFSWIQIGAICLLCLSVYLVEIADLRAQKKA